MFICLHAKYPLLSHFKETYIFFDIFLKDRPTQISNFMQLVQLEPNCSMPWINRHDKSKSLFAIL